jgi:sugar (pentulose or hexulose) kinase
MEQDLVLAIDFGTQSIRVIAFDARGQMVARVQHALAPYSEPQPGWVEQEPDYFWQVLCRATRSLVSDDDLDLSRIRALALTTQRNTVINLDTAGQALRPAIVWMDQRVVDKPPPLPWYWKLAFRLMGQSATMDYLQGQAEMNWIAVNQPDIWQRTARYLFLSGYLHHRLTDRFVDSTANQVGYVPFDFRNGRWAPAWHWKWAAVKVRREVLPEVVAPGEVIGELTQAAAEATGLKAGLAVIASAGDKACEVLGAACLDPHIACLSFGTQATVSTINPRYVEPIQLLPAFPAPVPGHYCTEVTVVRGFWMVTWFKEQFAALEAMDAERNGQATEALLDEMIRDIQPGSLGLVLQPFWGGGVRYPGIAAKGAVIGFGGVHTRAHLYRAILEGLAYALRDGKERIERRTGIPISRVRVSGGGSRSDVAMQIAADVFGLPAERAATSETSALGAAINAAVGSGLHADYPSAVRAMTGEGETFEPDAANQDIYDQLYRRVYHKLYDRLESLYESIREITGYPE